MNNSLSFAKSDCSCYINLIKQRVIFLLNFFALFSFLQIRLVCIISIVDLFLPYLCQTLQHLCSSIIILSTILAYWPSIQTPFNLPSFFLGSRFRGSYRGSLFLGHNPQNAVCSRSPYFCSVSSARYFSFAFFPFLR